MRYLALSMSMTRDHTFNVGNYYRYTGIDYVEVKGNSYLAALPGPSMIAAPFVAALDLIFLRFHLSAEIEKFIYMAVLILIIGAVPLSFMTVLFYRIAHRFAGTPKDAAAAALAMCFGTMIFINTTQFSMGDVLAMFFCWSAYYILFMNRGALSVMNSALVGICFGAAMWNAMQAAFVILIIGVYLPRDRRLSRLFIVALFAALAIIPLLLYLKACFGGYFTAFVPAQSNASFSYAAAAKPHGDFVIPTIGRFLDLLVKPYRGFFIYNPICLLGAFTLGKYARRSGAAFRDDLEARDVTAFDIFVVVGVFVSLLVFNASYFYWWAGISWGPRYLLASVPFFMLLSASYFRYINRLALWVLIGASILLNVVGSQIFWDTTYYSYAAQKNNIIHRMMTPSRAVLIVSLQTGLILLCFYFALRMWKKLFREPGENEGAGAMTRG